MRWIKGFGDLHPKMQRYIREGWFALFFWTSMVMMYVIYVDMTINAYYGTNIPLTIFMLGMGVFLTNLMIVLTPMLWRCMMLMVKTCRKANVVLKNK